MNAIPKTYRAIQCARVDWMRFKESLGDGGGEYSFVDGTLPSNFIALPCQLENATVYYRATGLDAARVLVEVWKERTEAGEV